MSAQDVLNALNPEDGLAFSLSLTVVNPYDQSNNIYSEIKGYEGEGETYLEENGALTHHYHENEEGNAVVPTLTKDNEVIEVEVMTIDQDTLEYVNVPYADLVDNPFKELELSDIDESETGFAIELSDEDGLRYGYFLTGYEDIEVDKLTIEVENGEIGQIKGECADIGTALEQNLLFPEFTMSLIAKEEAVNEPTPYPEMEEQQAIAEAFEKLKQGNYTANLIDVDSTGYYADVHGTLEVSEGLVYATYSQGIEDNEDNGYIVTKEGYIAPYLEQDGGIVGTAREQEGTLQDILVADYSIDPALFIPQDAGGHFRQRAPDAELGGTFSFNDVHTGLAGLCQDFFFIQIQLCKGNAANGDGGEGDHGRISVFSHGERLNASAVRAGSMA